MASKTAPQNNCLICASPYTKTSRTGQSSSIPQSQGGAVSSHSEVILILRRLLKIPSELCQAFLMQHGNPTDWGIVLCGNCKESFLDRMQNISETISGLQQQLNGIQDEVVAKMISRLTDTSTANGPTKTRGKRKNKSDPKPVVKKICNWILEKSQVVEVGNGKNKKTAAEIDLEIGIKAQQVETDKAFKALGGGKKLCDNSEPQPGPSSSCFTTTTASKKVTTCASATNASNDAVFANNVSSVQVLTNPKSAAGAAAMARIMNSKPVMADEKQRLANRQIAYIKEQAQKQWAAEKEQEKLGENNNLGEDKGLRPNSNGQEAEVSSSSSAFRPPSPRIIDPASYIVKGLYFRCPLIGPGLFPKRDADEKIQEFLLKQLKDENVDKGETACSLIRSCNKPHKATACADTLITYLDNLIRNPKEEKFKQIRCLNKAYKDRVAGALGAEQFLKEAGFEKTFVGVVGWDETQEEEVWQYDRTEEDIAVLIDLRDMLKTSVAIKPDLDRNAQVLDSASLQKRSEIPDEFYNLTREEVKREQMLKTEKVELESTIRTKAMRDRDEMKEQRLYRYGVVRIRFPDGLVLQGTFEATDTLSSVYEFVTENLLLDDLPFTLIRPPGENLNTIEDRDIQLNSIGLIPKSVLNFQAIDPPVVLSAGEISYLKPELLQHRY